MYRELASLDAFGVPGGPYTGKPRTVRFADLPASVRLRLERCVSREELPAPLLTAAAPRWRIDSWVGVLALVLVVGGGLEAFPGLVPMWCLPLATAALAFAGWLLQRLVARDNLARGMYLFPLDIVEAEGGSLRLTPMGSLRRAGIRRAGAALALELQFDHGALYRFECADEAAATRAYAKLVEAQAAVERVTFGRDLEETVDLDPLFAIRGDNLTRSFAPLRAVLATLAGALCGMLCFAGFSVRADNRVWNAALAEHTVAAYRGYVQQGGHWHRAEAALRARELELAQEPAPPAPALEPTFAHRADAELTAPQVGARASMQQDATMRYVAHVMASQGDDPWQRNVHFAGYLQRIFDAAREHGDDGLYFVFEHRLHGLVSEQLDLQSELETAVAAREERLLAAFGQVLSETIPTAVLTVASLAPEAAHDRAFVVHVVTSVNARSARAFDVDFEVTPRSGGAPLAQAFHLAMPAPERPLVSVRPRSLFHLADTNGPTRDVDLVTARAFDRLYDEVFSFFFPGNPVVPLAPEAP